MKMFPLLAAVAASLWLAGCATPPPPPALAAAAPPQWYAPLPHQGTLTDLTQWWQQLDDPLLVRLIESAQAASPTVASARSRIEQARATRTSAQAGLLPTLDAQASLQRGNTQPPVPLATTLQAGVQAGWEIDLFGGNTQALRAAQSRLEAAQAGWHDARVSVAAETATSYVNLRTCRRQLDVTANDAGSRAETARLTDLTARAGFTAPATAALARASAAEAAVRSTQQAAQCELELKVLVALSALPEPQLREQLQQPWQEPERPLPLPILALPAQLLEQRPDVYQAERDVAAAAAEIGSAQSQRYPRLTLNGSIAAGLVRIGGATQDAQTWSIGPLAVSLPLFDGGRRAANVEAAKARYQEAVALYTGRVRQAVREVEQALVNLESARRATQDARIASDNYRASFVATEARYRSGLGTLVELEDARRTLLAAQTTLVTLQHDRLAAWIALYRAVGGGWTRPDMPSA
ncbi:efflux transporter outer membrane subunit [Caenimonas terrae]|uniref:Efflux transporter outer membrane subunit n=1 Tax=Caenimonas terrae TaxID=696074 RepID=A0ABW0N8B6_9BURK